MIKKYILLGAAGYVAPRHMAAIRANDGQLVAAMDVIDSVGVLDNYFPTCLFYTAMNDLEKFVRAQKQKGDPVDFLVVCTPNDLHVVHCLWGLKWGMDVICEKPLALNSHELMMLEKTANQERKQIFTVLQLRHHPTVLALKEYLRQGDNCTSTLQFRYEVYRGDWYFKSWKGDESRSGGILTNIGIHLFDLMIYLFGQPSSFKIIQATSLQVIGSISFGEWHVDWHIRIKTGSVSDFKPIREIRIGERSWQLTEGFEELHEEIYRGILNGNGYHIRDAAASITLVEELSLAIITQSVKQ